MTNHYPPGMTASDWAYVDGEADEDCPMCGGIGFLLDECECQEFEDTCCCLNPTPPVCPECVRWAREKLKDDSESENQP